MITATTKPEFVGRAKGVDKKKSEAGASAAVHNMIPGNDARACTAQNII